MATNHDETGRALGESPDTVLPSHESPAGLPCKGGWAEAQPVVAPQTPRYRCRSCGAVKDVNDPELWGRGHSARLIELKMSLRPVAHRILQVALGSRQRSMAAAIRRSPVGTVPLLLVQCDHDEVFSCGPRGVLWFNPEVPRSAVPRTLERTAEEILTHYDSAANLPHEGLRCLGMVQIYQGGTLFFDQTSVVFLNEGPAPGEDPAPRTVP